MSSHILITAVSVECLLWCKQEERRMSVNVMQNGILPSQHVNIYTIQFNVFILKKRISTPTRNKHKCKEGNQRPITALDMVPIVFSLCY